MGFLTDFFASLFDKAARGDDGSSRRNAPRAPLPPGPGGVLDRAGKAPTRRPSVLPPDAVSDAAEAGVTASVGRATVPASPAPAPEARDPGSPRPPSSPRTVHIVAVLDPDAGIGSLVVDGRTHVGAIFPSSSYFPTGPFLVRGFGLQAGRVVCVTVAREDGSSPFRVQPVDATSPDRMVLYEDHETAPRDALRLVVRNDAFRTLARVVAGLRRGDRCEFVVRSVSVASRPADDDAYFPFDDVPTIPHWEWAALDLDATPVDDGPSDSDEWTPEGAGEVARAGLAGLGYAVLPSDPAAACDPSGASADPAASRTGDGTPSDGGGVPAPVAPVAPACPTDGAYVPSGGAYDR